MDVVPTLLSQGGFGVMAGVFLWLYLSERGEHKETRKTLSEAQEARRLDAVETRNDVTSLLPGISQSLLHISDKIEAVQTSKRKR